MCLRKPCQGSSKILCSLWRGPAASFVERNPSSAAGKAKELRASARFAPWRLVAPQLFSVAEKVGLGCGNHACAFRFAAREGGSHSAASTTERGGGAFPSRRCFFFASQGRRPEASSEWLSHENVAR